jgi:ATP-binding cassette, subfamily B, bacterial MsbA
MSGLYLRLLAFVRPYWLIFSAAIFMMVIAAIAEATLPAQIKPLLDGGFVAKNPDLIIIMPLIIVALFLIKGLAMFISSVTITWIASKVVMELRRQMFARLLALPTCAFDNSPAGSLMSKVTYDVSRVMAASTEVLIVLVRDSLIIIGLLAWIIYLNWQLSITVLIIAPIIILMLRWVSHNLRQINTNLQNNMGSLTHILAEAINGHKLVKIFAAQNYEQQRFAKINQHIQQLEVKNQIIAGISVFGVQMLTAAVLGVIIIIAARQAAQNNMTVGDFVSFFTAMGMMFAPLKRLTKINEQLQQGLAAAQSIFALLDRETEADKGNIKIQQVHGDIRFNDVTLSYGTKPALENINFHIQAGETIALVGESGSGKSTLVNALPRFYPISSGQILIDNIDINNLTLESLRANIALVSQEIELFNDTIAANIAYGHTDIAFTDIIAAAKAAYAEEFILATEHGFNTLVGEHGVKLSGGQRQRLAIARAFLKNAPILIFDEATSALDTNSEQQVQISLEKLKQGRTTIIIAHRLSTTINADRIFVLEHGRIIEIGNHAALLAANGKYTALYLENNSN